MGGAYAGKLNKSLFACLCAVLLCVFALPAGTVPASAASAVTAQVSVSVESSDPDDIVTVTMTPQDGAPAPEESTIYITGTDGGVFEGLTFTGPGDYVYTVQQVGTSLDIAYDSAVYTVTVRVENEDGGLVCSYWAVRSGETGKSEDISFTNTSVTSTAYYIVEHYLEQPDGTYQLADSYTYSAKIGETVYGVPNSYEHYEENTAYAGRIPSGVVYAAGTAEASAAVESYSVPDTDTTAAYTAYADATAAYTAYSKAAAATAAYTTYSKTAVAATAYTTYSETTEASEDVLTLKLYYSLERYTVTYSDGLGGIVFSDQIYTGQPYGTDTPGFDGTPTREGYVFAGWSPAVTDTVTGNVTYVALWEPVTASESSGSSSGDASGGSTDSSTGDSSGSASDGASASSSNIFGTGIIPKTGDPLWYVMWIGIVLICIGSILAAACARKEKNR